jgi:epoxyqueuosine reductase
MDLIQQTGDLGFVAVGFSRPGTPLFFNRFRAWVSEGKHAGMTWMERRLNLRENPARLLQDCRTIISLAYPYSHRRPCTPEGLSVARYSEPQQIDYHTRLRNKAKILAKAIRQQFPGTRTRICVDSAPILERSFACQSGIGFIGKNTQFIIPGHGSYLFLAEILTTAAIPVSESAFMESRCGSCTWCLDACPTGALEAPYRLNAAKCLSYRTIEQKEALDTETGKKMGDCFFGCDVCQEVCPLNKGDEPGEVVLPSIESILSMDEETFQGAFGKTALARPGLAKIKDNILAMKPAR